MLSLTKKSSNLTTTERIRKFKPTTTVGIHLWIPTIAVGLNTSLGSSEQNNFLQTALVAIEALGIRECLERAKLRV